MVDLLARLFSADKVVEKTIDTVKHLTDEAFFTKEEQSEAERAARTEGRHFLLEWLKASSGSRLARRVIAIATTSVWLGMYVFATALNFSAIWAGKLQAKLLESAQLIDARADEMIPVVMLVYGFYFAAPYMGDLAKGALARFAGKGEQ